ncbi:hypothetical protein PINS_up015140 [Pythium insidiosum]|nr:hypothetical protein PINS_up015140 [Pythium insidiosum]
MAHIETKDPFGFVGSHVVQRVRRSARGRRRPRQPSHAAADGSDPDATTELVLHGWITRYDVRLDAYTLFLPGDADGDHRNTTTLHSRGDVMKFISNPEFQLRREEDAAFPPPIEDTTSRFVGLWLRKATPSPHKRRIGTENEAIRGRVACFRPFADRYRVEYDDGSSDNDVTESDIIDSLIATVRAMENGAAGALPSLPPTSPVSRKRRRPSLDAEDEETEDEREEEEEDSTDIPIKAELPMQVSAQEKNDEREDDAEIIHVDMSAWEDVTPPPSRSSSPPLPVPPPSPPRPSPRTIKREAAAAAASNGEVAVELDFDEPMEELVPLEDEPASIELPNDADEDDDDDEEMRQVKQELESMSRLSAPVTPEIVSLMNDADNTEQSPVPRDATPVSAKDAETSSSVDAETRCTPPFYIMEYEPHVPTVPFEKRSKAFEFVRTELQRIVTERLQESFPNNTTLSTTSANALLDTLRNPDIKSRDAVRRFVEMGGLFILNDTILADLADTTRATATQHERVLYHLKMLAMLPTPSQHVIMETSIGKTVGRLIKASRGPGASGPMSGSKTNGKTTAGETDALLPRCVPHLARWIKARWIATMERDSNTKPAPVKKPKLARPTAPPQVIHDATPIPRLSQRPNLAPPPAPAPKPIDVLTAVATPSRAKSGLKPDWMRQKEALSRTRFTVNTDTRAEHSHYKRDRRPNLAPMGVTPAAPAPAPAASQQQQQVVRENDLPAGERGVFGRRQRVGFHSRWSVCEFFKDTPPTAVRRFNSGASTFGGGPYSYNSSQSAPVPPPSRHMTPRRPILRRNSKYGDELKF